MSVIQVTEVLILLASSLPNTIKVNCNGLRWTCILKFV